MSNLRDLFDEATASAPPSRLSIEDVFSARQSRRRRRRQNAALAAISAMVMVVAGGIIFTNKFAADPPIGETGPSAVTWVGRGDATHLYLIKSTCGRGPSAEPTGAGSDGPGCQEMLASNDGGTTWVSRGGTAERPRVLGPLTLMRYAGGSGTRAPVTEPSLNFELSIDGGATWERLPGEGTPVNALPPGGAVVNGFGDDLTIYDPAQGRLRRLANQPGLRRILGELMVIGAKDLWVSGLNLTTLRPAVAVSHDGGASWTERDLPGSEVMPQPTLPNGEIDPSQASGQPIQLITGDGTTAFATVYQRSAQPASPPQLPGTQGLGWYSTYVTTDGGDTWRAVAAEATTPSYASAWTTADGRIVISLPSRDIGGVMSDAYAVSADGITYAPATLPGLPASARSMDGSTAFSDDAMYVSDDGWTWREVWRE